MSCEYYKIATVSAYNTKQIDNLLVFENDTIKVSYDFWDKRGAMRFSIYNKLNVPLYFDWKKSAFILNDEMMSYWQDETNTVGSSTSSASYLNGSVINGKSKSKSIRQERVAALPPHSLISSYKYSLVPVNTSLPIQEFTISDTPLRFRNYLAVSTSEQFDKAVFYIDNAFFVSSVEIIKASKVLSWVSGNAFYMSMPGH